MSVQRGVRTPLVSILLLQFSSSLHFFNFLKAHLLLPLALPGIPRLSILRFEGGPMRLAGPVGLGHQKFFEGFVLGLVLFDP